MEWFGEWSTMWWIFIFLVVLSATYLYMTWPYNYFKNQGIPGPKPLPFFGNLRDFGKKPLGEVEYERVVKYGNVVGVYEGWDKHLIIADLDMLKEILIKDFESFSDRKSFTRAGLLMHSLFDQEGANWKRQRVQLSPYFSTGTMKMSSASINHILDNLIDFLSRKSQQKEMIEARNIADYFTLDAICATAFGVQVNSVKQPDAEIIQNARKIFKTINMSNIILMLKIFLPGFAKILDFFKIVAFDFTYFDNLIRELIKQRRNNTKDSPDFIHILLKAGQAAKEQKADAIKGLSDDEIIANGILFLLAGYDTTAGTLGFLLYNLTLHEECQEKVYEQIQENIGNEEVNYETVQNLHYLDMCFDESLRLYPLAQRFDRKCVKDTVIKGVPIKTGTYINVPLWYLHRNPEIWENPEVFDPERFTTENKKSRDPLYFSPFGQGPRHCIGMRLAGLEIKMAVVRILQRFKLIRNDKTQVPLQLDPASFHTASKDGIWISLEERK